jgi:uncharacterized protein (TIGR03083 family)
MGQIGELYAEGRNRFIDVVAGVDPDTPVVTCPAWTVRNVLSHVTGICADILGGNLDGVATDPWTAAQVDARRDRSIADIAAEWQETGPQIDAMVDAFGRTGEQLLLDLTTHEFDVRHALRRPGPKDLPVWDIGADFGVEVVLRNAVETHGLGPMAVRIGECTWHVGPDGEPQATLTASAFEFVRALTGRRSAAQVADMDWSGWPAPYIQAFEGGLFTFAATDITE